MTYITNADIELRLGPAAYVQLTDDASVGAANPAVADAARLAAEGEVNSYLARRYRTPIDLTVHPELAGLLAAVSLDLAEYRLHARRPPVPDDVTLRHRLALEWLARIAAGDATLPAAAAVAAPVSSGTVAAVRGNDALLNREDMSAL